MSKKWQFRLLYGFLTLMALCTLVAYGLQLNSDADHDGWVGPKDLINLEKEWHQGVAPVDPPVFPPDPNDRNFGNIVPMVSSGNRQTIFDEPASWVAAALSPDGNRLGVAFIVPEPPGSPDPAQLYFAEKVKGNPNWYVQLVTDCTQEDQLDIEYVEVGCPLSDFRPIRPLIVYYNCEGVLSWARQFSETGWITSVLSDIGFHSVSLCINPQEQCAEHAWNVVFPSSTRTYTDEDLWLANFCSYEDRWLTKRLSWDQACFVSCDFTPGGQLRVAYQTIGRAFQPFEPTHAMFWPPEIHNPADPDGFITHNDGATQYGNGYGIRVAVSPFTWKPKVVYSEGDRVFDQNQNRYYLFGSLKVAKSTGTSWNIQSVFDDFVFHGAGAPGCASCSYLQWAICISPITDRITVGAVYDREDLFIVWENGLGWKEKSLDWFGCREKVDLVCNDNGKIAIAYSNDFGTQVLFESGFGFGF